MPRLTPIDRETAQGKAKALLDGVHSKLGMAPNIMRTMAQSPAVLEAYLSFSGTLGTGNLSAKLREQIALAVSAANGCTYCTSAHSAIGANLGLDRAEMANNRRGQSSDPKVQAAITFALAVVEKRGWVSDDDLAQVRSAGYTDGDIAEMIAAVAQNVLTNYFNHVAQPEVDFPRIEASEPASA